MTDHRKLSRRDFVRAGAAGTALLLGNTLPLWADAPKGMPQRVLGKTNVKVPILGLGTVAVGSGPVVAVVVPVGPVVATGKAGVSPLPADLSAASNWFSSLFCWRAV